MIGAVTGQIRLAIVAPSGSGKSTVARFLREAFERHDLTVEVIRLSAPLYRLQDIFYQEARRTILQGSQNQPLLEQIATSLRKINPTCLIEQFSRRMNETRAMVVINDDLRDDVVDWPVMRDAGFAVVRVVVKEEVRRHRLQLRDDIAAMTESTLDLRAARIPASIVLENNVSLSELSQAIDKLALSLLMSSAPTTSAETGGSRC